MSSYEDAIKGVNRWLDEHQDDDENYDSILALKQDLMDMSANAEIARLRGTIGGASMDKDSLVVGEGEQ